MAPSRLSGGRLRSLPVSFGLSDPRTASRACTREFVSTSGVPEAMFTPTSTASTVTLSTVSGSFVRARMPWLDRPTAVPVTVVAASRSIPVRPPLMRPPVICAPLEKLRTASFSTPSATRSLITTPVVPDVVTTPS